MAPRKEIKNKVPTLLRDVNCFIVDRVRLIGKWIYGPGYGFSARYIAFSVRIMSGHMTGHFVPFLIQFIATRVIDYHIV